MREPTDAQLAKALRVVVACLKEDDIRGMARVAELVAKRLEARGEITDAKLELGALAMIAALDEMAPKIASEKHHLFKFDLETAKRVLRPALEVMERGEE